MKKINFLLAVFFCIFSFAQNQRFIYEYKSIKDSTEKNNIETDLMYLDIAKKGSKFYSRSSFVNDSIISAQIKAGNTNINPAKIKGVKFIVEKSYPDYQIIIFEQFLTDKYKISDDRKQNWKILPDKKKIGEFNVQKATLDFLGRKWIAWFTIDIPIQDGPYKFHGLPGLIVEISDNTNSHIFEMKGVKKLMPQEEWQSDSENPLSGSPIAIDVSKYKTIYLDNRNNPSKNLKQILATGSTTVEMKDQNGNVIDIQQAIRKIERNAKLMNAKNNNLLELDLLK